MIENDLSPALNSLSLISLSSLCTILSSHTSLIADPLTSLFVTCS